MNGEIISIETASKLAKINKAIKHIKKRLIKLKKYDIDKIITISNLEEELLEIADILEDKQ